MGNRRPNVVLLVIDNNVQILAGLCPLLLHKIPAKIFGEFHFTRTTSENEVPPPGVELLLQHTGFTHDCKQGSIESGTVVDESRLVLMLQTPTSVTPS